MKSETLYRKVGRRYVPVEECELNYYGHRFPEGFSITYCKPGSTLTRFKIEPSNIELKAAFIKIEEKITDIVYNAFQYRKPENLTENQVTAWNEFVKCGGSNVMTIPSASEISQKILKEIEELCSNQTN